MINAITVDVEEYFHATEAQNVLGETEWESIPSRIHHQVQTTLDLFNKRSIKATFFILGWVADRYPELVQADRRSGTRNRLSQLRT